MSKLDTAIELAQEHHKDQKYANEPYLNHLLRVAMSVKDCGYGETSQIVAILHDILEDTDCPALKLDELFGREITDAVMAMTHAKGENYSQYLTNVVLRNPIAKVVKFADIMDNWKNSYINEGYEHLQEKYERAMKIMIANWNKYN